jgi:hypothetical protein
MKNLRGLSIALAMCAMPALAEKTNASRVNPVRPVAGAVSSDDRTASNNFFLEGGGPGLIYSLNYERILEQDFGLRVGFSYQSFTATASSGGSSGSASVSFVTVPVIASYLGVSSGNHVLELGAGGTAVYASGSASGTGLAASGSGMMALGTALIGYRRQPVNGGFQFRVGVEALAGKGLSISNPDPNKFGVLPWMYLSLGFSI